MKKYIKVFSDGTINFHFNSGVKNKKLQILEKDYKKNFLFKKNKNFSRKNSDYSSKYKNQYLF